MYTALLARSLSPPLRRSPSPPRPPPSITTDPDLIPTQNPTTQTPADIFRRYRNTDVAQTRTTYPKELKLMAIRHYRLTGNKAQVAREFGICRKMLREWIKNEKKIIGLKKGARKSSSGRTAELPLLEDLLYQAFVEVRERGLKISCGWFFVKARKLYETLYPDKVTTGEDGEKSYVFKFSVGWFNGFKRRKNISYRCVTNKATKVPAEKEGFIRNFHHFIRRNARLQQTCPCGLPEYAIVPSHIDGDHEYEAYQDVGRFKLANIVNMDQTPLPFENLGGRTYEHVGQATVWAKSQGSGLDKRQATAQLSICADGVPRYSKPVLVFSGKGSDRLIKGEKHLWDPRVRVYFQSSAWVDEEIFCQWLYHDWGSQSSLEPRMLTLDVHKPHRTGRALHLMRRYNTLPAFIPPGCTSLVQPLDVSINKIFKDLVDSEFRKHYAEHLDEWVEGKLSAKQRRILLTHWVGEAWDQLHLRYKHTIVDSFRKCGITVPIDGSCDSEIRIKGLENYVVGDWTQTPSISEVEGRFVAPVCPDDDNGSGVGGRYAGQLTPEQQIQLYACLTHSIPAGQVASLDDIEFVTEEEAVAETGEWLERADELWEQLDSLPQEQRPHPYEIIGPSPEFY